MLRFNYITVLMLNTEANNCLISIRNFKYRVKRYLNEMLLCKYKIDPLGNTFVFFTGLETTKMYI